MQLSRIGTSYVCRHAHSYVMGAEYVMGPGFNSKIDMEMWMLLTLKSFDFTSVFFIQYKIG